eukprot:TRINITY_DN6576_c1_g1_i3.p1 TRINITY_DN6576_c1_g1~~TRINITY_DN6576_c1_g1_i3.p1  ORF type:complete len:476 (-),score=71.16 TRINITY_DN6576_c1_g1_i3:663-1979(-)
MIRVYLFCFICAQFVIVGQAQDEAEGKNTTTSLGSGPTMVFVSSLRNTINPLGVNLYEELCVGVNNCVFSPYSLYVLISMLAQGARETTFSELVSLLTIEGDSFGEYSRMLEQVIATINVKIDGFQLSSANSIYTDQEDYEIKEAYISALQTIYQGEQKQLNFKGDPEGARVEINQDISDATNGLIQDLLPQGTINELTQMVLTNAIYFKANWLLPFDKEKTVLSDFKISPTQTVQVPMMYVDGEFRFKFMDDATMVELPYDSKFPSNADDGKARENEEWDVSMILLLPTENVSFDDLDLNFFIEESQSMISTSKKEFQTPLEVYLPKFEIEFDAGSMKQVLTSMGLMSAFDPALANFGNITDEKGLFLSDVFHKAKIIVNEEGTEAAAAAAAFLNFESLILSREIRFDRPFGFMMIYKPSASILFMGKVSDPTAAAK